MTSAQSLGLTPGTWNIDPTHSTVGFSVKHMMVSKVKGKFSDFAGAITVADEIEQSAVTATIQAASVDTGNEQRDGHLRSADFFNADNHQAIEFASASVKADGGDWVVSGDLTINGVTKPVDLEAELGGVSPDGKVAGFEAETEISREDFGITFNIPMDGGGVVIGDKIKITLDIEAAKAE